MPLGAWASRPRLVEKTYISPLRFFDYSLRRPQAGRLRSQWHPPPKKTQIIKEDTNQMVSYKVTLLTSDTKDLGIFLHFQEKDLGIFRQF